jgi:archaellum component FlaD/FlaE
MTDTPAPSHEQPNFVRWEACKDCGAPAQRLRNDQGADTVVCMNSADHTREAPRTDAKEEQAVQKRVEEAVQKSEQAKEKFAAAEEEIAAALKEGDKERIEAAMATKGDAIEEHVLAVKEKQEARLDDPPTPPKIEPPAEQGDPSAE